jgi:hypothetical protein
MDPIRKTVEEIEALISAGYFKAAAQVLHQAIERYGERPWLLGLRHKHRLDNVPTGQATVPKSAKDTNFASFTTAGAHPYQVQSLSDWPPFNPPVPPDVGGHYMFREGLPPQPARRLYSIPNATVSIDRSRGQLAGFYIFDQQGRYLPDISFGNTPFRLRSGQHRINQPVGFMDDRFSKFNVCHLWFDKLPRIFELREAVPELALFLMTSETSYANDIMDILGISLISHQHVTGPKITLSMPELVISSNSVRTAHPAHHCYRHFARPVAVLNAQSPVPDAPATRIYIDRSAALTRRLINADEVWAVLKDKGFQSLRLEDLSFPQQRAAFANAQAVVGVHGAGLANVIFCQRSAAIVEILPANYATPAFWYAAEYFGLTYLPLVAAISAGAAPLDYAGFVGKRDQQNRADVYVDPTKLSAHLEKILTL